MVGFRDILRAMGIYMHSSNPSKSHKSLSDVSERQIVRHLWRIEGAVTRSGERFTAVRLVSLDRERFDSILLLQCS